MLDGVTKNEVLAKVMDWYLERCAIDPFFEIATGNDFTERNTDRIAKVLSSTGYTHEQCEGELRRNLWRLGNGAYVIRLRPEGNKTKDYSKIRFIIPFETGAPQWAVGQAGIGAVDPATVEDKIAKAVAEALEKHQAAENLKRLERELEEIKAAKLLIEKEKAEIEERAEAPWNKFIGAITPYVGQIIPGILPGAATVSYTHLTLPTNREV